MNVSYELVVSRDNMDFVPESEIALHPERYSEYLAFVRTVHIGRIIIEEEDRRFVLRDEMWHIAVILCFGAAEPLLNGTTFEYRIMQTGRVIAFEPQEDQVKIQDVSGETVVFNKTGLLKALYDCGNRYLHLLTDVLPHRGHEQSAAVYKTQADLATAVLTAHRIL